MAEWSKALVLGTSLSGGAGSNPACVIFFYYLLTRFYFIFLHCFIYFFLSHFNFKKLIHLPLLPSFLYKKCVWTISFRCN